jgi:hypothetical protein
MFVAHILPAAIGTSRADDDAVKEKTTDKEGK